MPDNENILMLYEESSVRSVSSALRYLNGNSKKTSHVEHPSEIQKIKNMVKPFFDWGRGYNKACDTYMSGSPRWYGLLPLFKANDCNMIIHMCYGFAGISYHDGCGKCTFQFSPCSELTIGSNYSTGVVSDDWDPYSYDIPFNIGSNLETTLFTFHQFDDIRVIINTESTPVVSFFKNEEPACEDITLTSSVYSSYDASLLKCGRHSLYDNGTALSYFQTNTFWSDVKFFRIMADPWET